MSEFKGVLIVKNETQQITDSFKKREFVVEQTNHGADGTEYKNPVKFQLVQDKCDKLDYVNVGDEVNIKFNLKGNKYEKNNVTSYFVNLDAWFVEKLDSAGVTSADNPEQPQILPVDEDPSDDLPF